MPALSADEAHHIPWRCSVILSAGDVARPRVLLTKCAGFQGGVFVWRLSSNVVAFSRDALAKRIASLDGTSAQRRTAIGGTTFVRLDTAAELHGLCDAKIPATSRDATTSPASSDAEASV